jgi:hypothetical protein
MKRFLGLLAIVFVGVAGWRVTEMISRDAVSMAIGFVFGVLAGIPVALFVLAAQRRREEYYEQRQPQRYAQQPPVIVVAGGQPQHYPPQASHRQEAPLPWGIGGGSAPQLLPPPDQDTRFGMDR